MASSPRHSRRLLQAAAALGVAATLLTAACGRSDGPPAAPSAGAASSSVGAASAGAPIVIAATYPQTGPLAAVGSVGRGAEAYIKKVQASGGVNGRPITWIGYDDGYDPARMVANVRRAVERDHADVVVSFGGPSLTIRPYLNQRKVFHLVLAGNSPLSDTRAFPYSHAWYPDIRWEAELTARHIKQATPGARIGVLGLNNDITDSAAAGFTAAGLKPTLVLKVAPGQQDLTSQIAQLRGAGVNSLFFTVSPGQAIGAIKYMKATHFSPMVVLYSTTAGRKGSINALGPDAKGLYTNLWLADPADRLWAGAAGVADYQAAVRQYGQASDADDLLGLEGYAAAEALVAALKAAPAPTAEGITSGWQKIKNVNVTGLPPGTTLQAGPGGRLVYNFQLVQFNGAGWTPVGGVQNAITTGVAH
jgi:branched-chain amino acid transport system substrate-binding protein